MSRLLTSLGRVFATGESSCYCRPLHPDSEDTRLFIPIRLGSIPTEAVVDTGGEFLVLDPEMAAAIGVGSAPGLGEMKVRLRGVSYKGYLERYPLTLVAAAGDEITVQATTFLPMLDEGDDWPLPTYIGWFGCLERVRFAVDPLEEKFYFGALSAPAHGPAIAADASGPE